MRERGCGCAGGCGAAFGCPGPGRGGLSGCVRGGICVDVCVCMLVHACPCVYVRVHACLCAHTRVPPRIRACWGARPAAPPPETRPPPQSFPTLPKFRSPFKLRGSALWRAGRRQQCVARCLPALNTKVDDLNSVC